MYLNLFNSKCESEWVDCIEEDEKYLRQSTDYYSRFYGDMCPAYSPDSQADAYPGQPFVETRKETHQVYPYKQYQQNNYHYSNNKQHANRRQEQVKTQDGSIARVYTGPKGERVRCDYNIEKRDADFEEVMNSDTGPYDPCADGQDTSGLCFDDEE